MTTKEKMDNPPGDLSKAVTPTLVSPDGKWMYHETIGWVPIPGGGAVDMRKGQLHHYDDFANPFGTAAGSLFGSRCLYVVASDATFASKGQNGGVGVITLGGDDADAVAVYGPLGYEPDEAGRIWMRVRFQSSNVAAASLFIGFSDAITDTVIIADEDGTINTVATDAFGVLLEGEQEGTWQTMGVGNGTDDTQQAVTNLPTDLAASTWTTIFIEGDNQGNSANTVVRYRVWIDGKIMQTASTDNQGWTVSAARSRIVYTPAYMSADDRNTAYTVDLAEVEANGGVGSSFD